MKLKNCLFYWYLEPPHGCPSAWHSYTLQKGSKAQKALTSYTPWIMNFQVRMCESRRRHYYGETWPRSSSYSIRAPEADLYWPGFEPTTSCTAGEHSSKELLQQLMLLIFGSSTWLPQCMALNISGGQYDDVRPLTSTLGGRGMGCRDRYVTSWDPS